ncbi:MAG: CocE/NonD family hydrolase, partial [Hyphomicrobiaceae bacterium]
KAVISLSSTVDRFNDDIHHKGGTLLSANLTWSGTMLAYLSRPPDPAIVGERWREMWLKRLENEPLPIMGWLQHQRRDAFWRHGSICEDYSAIEAAVLMIAGWADGYRNAPPTAAANLDAPVKAINGPWIHKYPHFAWPHPRADFHAEALRWWDRWLKGKRNGAEKLPAYRAYVMENVRPRPWRDRDEGRWVAEKSWPSKAIRERRLVLNPGGALEARARTAAGAMRLSSPENVGVMAGEYFTIRPDADLAADQRLDDAGSLVFETAPLEDAVEILGRPRLTLKVAIDRPLGNLCARLIDLHPDGTGFRVSFGVLNLAHRMGNAEPRPMRPGEAETVEIALDESGYRFLAGHRIRIAISTAYWPMVLPPPGHVTAEISLGGDSHLTLPVRRGGDVIDMPEPADPDPLPHYREISPGRVARTVEHDLTAGVTRYRVHDDGGAHEIPETGGLVAREMKEETFTIRPDDPLSAVSETHWVIERSRGDWSVRTVTRQRLTADATHFLIEASLEAFEGDRKVAERRWREKIARDCM